MGTILKNAVYLENGTIVNNYSKTGIENPALLLDCETGALFKWGDKDAISAPRYAYVDHKLLRHKVKTAATALHEIIIYKEALQKLPS